jgi:hypothetical protein
MRTVSVWVALVLALAAPAAIAAESFKLPKEVTPAMRRACEADVRRLCIGKDPTVAKVKRCMYANFYKFGKRCQNTLIAAGYSP